MSSTSFNSFHTNIPCPFVFKPGIWVPYAQIETQTTQGWTLTTPLPCGGFTREWSLVAHHWSLCVLPLAPWVVSRSYNLLPHSKYACMVTGDSKLTLGVSVTVHGCFSCLSGNMSRMYSPICMITVGWGSSPPVTLNKIKQVCVKNRYKTTTLNATLTQCE